MRVRLLFISDIDNQSSANGYDIVLWAFIYLLYIQPTWAVLANTTSYSMTYLFK